MLNKRFYAFTLLVAFGIVLGFAVSVNKVGVEKPLTLAPAFQLLGKPVKTLDRAFTKILPIDNLDEKQLGDAIASRYANYGSTESPKDLAYLQGLIAKLTIGNKKGFNYRILIMETSQANAFAMPGGILFVTSGLLTSVKSEAELVAVLGHEIGHVELSHCMDGVRFELLSRKIGSATLGELADIATGILLRPSFSKNQESESDEYGYKILLREGYDPFAMGRMFQRLKESSGGTEGQESPIGEYFMTHPYLDLRSEKFREKAKKQEAGMYYVGEKNLSNRTSKFELEYEDEFIKRD
ncbi:peptidase, M48 family [Leptospira inadai serovar Lyme str. 10]|uniref:Peptidase, M48 family n=2 Tax=Leptospira inadai serovar Lyme TaxID=293084 RepID=V6H989_9LEPT|nr:M48 family metallopeptidase [Leptospira inadai]EQA35472.1 peptidase, M48 family [Leptospira inadai serovar Lyme str. 10]PNV75395.1 peptidase M48 [Leptospira inadai serovar Lyme]